MSKKAVHTSSAPQAIGPYSQAISVDLGADSRMIFTAGQIALDPDSMEIVDGGIEAQTRQVLRNLTAVLEAAGAEWGHVVKTTIFLADMADFGTVNPIYGEMVADPPPARSTVAARELPLGVLIEIDLVAVV
jgi:2-iminobutanoate/2-iminopropanoate deaminase